MTVGSADGSLLSVRVSFPKAVGFTVLGVLAASAAASAIAIVTIRDDNLDAYKVAAQIVLAGTALSLFIATALGCLVDRDWFGGPMLSGGAISATGLAISLDLVLDFRAADEDLFKALGVVVAIAVTLVIVTRLSLSVGAAPAVVGSAAVTTAVAVALGIDSVVSITSGDAFLPFVGDGSELALALLVLTFAGLAVTALLHRTLSDADARAPLPRPVGLGLAAAVGVGAIASAILIATIDTSESGNALQDVAGKIVLTHVALTFFAITALATFVDRAWRPPLALAGAAVASAGLAVSVFSVWVDDPGEGVTRVISVLILTALTLALGARLALYLTGHAAVVLLAGTTLFVLSALALLVISQTVAADEVSSGILRAIGVLIVLSSWGALSTAVLNRTLPADDD